MIILRGGVLHWNVVNRVFKFENSFIDFSNFHITIYSMKSTITMDFREFNPKILRVISKTAEQLDNFED